ncbi:glycoside hydrolase [Lyophyllum atratum]|nr:glycoside hydrolase [Lyophyllum atratum]
MAFLYIFRGKGGLPVIDFSNICGLGSGRTFSGTDLTDCSFLESDIRNCQAKGKIVTLSLGGATSQVGFSSDAEAAEFGQLLWDMFLGKWTIDLDIEKGTSAHYAAMVNKIRSLAKGASKRYYITAAPQCPFPDVFISGALNNAFFDAVYVQFYNNYCETSVPSEFNFDVWITGTNGPEHSPQIVTSRYTSGAPGSSKAAGNGYVDIQTLSRIAKDAQRRYSSFGGVMLWDADVAYSGAPRPNPQPPSGPTKTSPGSTPANTPSSLPDLRFPDDFKDPRKTARVKRPSFTLDLRNDFSTAAPTGRTMTSRFFRFY